MFAKVLSLYIEQQRPCCEMCHAPTLLGNGHAPTLLGNGHAPTLLGNGHAPTLLGNGHAPTLLGNGHAPTLLGNGHAPTLLTALYTSKTFLAFPAEQKVQWAAAARGASAASAAARYMYKGKISTHAPRYTFLKNAWAGVTTLFFYNLSF